MTKKRLFPKLSELKKITSIFRYVLPYRWLFFLNMVLLVVTSLTSLAIPVLTGDLIDAAQGISERFKNANQVIFIMAAILLVQAIFSFIRILVQTKFTESAIVDLRSDIYQKIITLPTSFFDKNRVGELTSRLSSDVATLNEAFTSTMPQFVRQFLTMVIGIIVLVFMNLRLTIVMLATIPVIIILAIVFGRFIRKLSKERQDRLAESNTVVEETLQAVRSVKAYTNELFELFRYRKSINEVYQLAMKGSIYRAFFIAFITIGFFGAIVFILWQAAIMLSAGLISTGGLTTFIFTTFFIAGSIAGFGESLTNIQKTIGATDRVEEILAEQSEIQLNKWEGKEFHFNQDIKFKTISFYYEGEREIEVLKNIDFTINKGEKIALVGPSGAGKSTIAQLLLRFYQPQQGEIFIDDKSVSEFDLGNYRKHIGFVPQEVLLFGGSIRENIQYGKQDATEEELITAAKSANAYEFIEQFPQGLDTIVGERGVQLSGGQKQRIAIARAVLKNPPILILDEATSALDAESEHLVQQALEELMQNRTTLIIAHRLSTVRNADKIIVIEAGQIVEQGNHIELMNKEGLYSNLVEFQLN